MPLFEMEIALPSNTDPRTLVVTIAVRGAAERPADGPSWVAGLSNPAPRLRALASIIRRSGQLPRDEDLGIAGLLGLVGSGPLPTAGLVHAVWSALGLSGDERMLLAMAMKRVMDRLGSRVEGNAHLVERRVPEEREKKAQTEPQGGRTDERTETGGRKKKEATKDLLWAITPAGRRWVSRQLAILGL